MDDQYLHTQLINHPAYKYEVLPMRISGLYKLLGEECARGNGDCFIRLSVDSFDPRVHFAKEFEGVPFIPTPECTKLPPEGVEAVTFCLSSHPLPQCLYESPHPDEPNQPLEEPK